MSSAGAEAGCSSNDSIASGELLASTIVDLLMWLLLTAAGVGWMAMARVCVICTPDAKWTVPSQSKCVLFRSIRARGPVLRHSLLVVLAVELADEAHAMGRSGFVVGPATTSSRLVVHCLASRGRGASVSKHPLRTVGPNHG